MAHEDETRAEIEKLQNDLATIFTPTTASLTQQKRMQVVRDLALAFSQGLIELAPKSRERSIALTKIEEASMFGVASIARNPKLFKDDVNSLNAEIKE